MTPIRSRATLDHLDDPGMWRAPLERRAVLAASGAILAALTGCAPVLRASSTVNRGSGTSTGAAVVRARAAGAAAALPAPFPIPRPRPGPAVFISRGPANNNTLALTIDDGTSADVVACYAAFALETGFALTFFPNGSVAQNWEAQAETLRPLVERGQVQVGNHTWSHTDLQRMTDSAIRADLERNEDWIQRTFGITSRPWLRPPYGSRSTHTDGVAASLGFTHVVNWSGTFGDSGIKTAAQILGAAALYGDPGAIVLGHANHPAVTLLFDRLRATFAAKGLTPVTLDQMFGTSRRVG
jgi:peptidoglycan/xylan/chitin deacetylase (PgdA/CDA1 family)